MKPSMPAGERAVRQPTTSKKPLLLTYLLTYLFAYSELGKRTRHGLCYTTLAANGPLLLVISTQSPTQDDRTTVNTV